VEAILQHWSGQWKDCSDRDAPHEAGLLNLATDKAFHVLGWRPRWDFNQTVAATVSWYRTIHAQGPDVVPDLVKQQIKSYSEAP
jgi:CDP-glucose 4,6-dehydratase